MLNLFFKKKKINILLSFNASFQFTKKKVEKINCSIIISMGYPVASRISTLKKSVLEETDTIRGCVCKVEHATILSTVTKARPMTEQS
jgi:hypothetical protein